ncbi:MULTISPECIES: NUDIX domain-containing protein [unclassified Sinorhizobium]|uniref:NUDIX hydrolase n=1 Tax=unclassified Sinorhizobium TaxID=2613772 RepID=UPI003523B86E
MTPRPMTAASRRPRDAAALILIDRSNAGHRILFGRRGSRHVFFPDTYVFPGGRRDPRDHALPYSIDLQPQVTEKLLLSSRAGLTVSGARAMALAAVRELAEETGLVLGKVTEEAAGPQGLVANLGGLRYVARAITPPGQVRRYDTRFFCTFTDEAGIDPGLVRDSEELLDLQWLDIGDISCLNMPDITRIVLGDVMSLMKADPSLGFGTPVPFYLMRNGRFARDVL